MKRNPKAPRQELPLLPEPERSHTCQEVAGGFSVEQVAIEALRCLNCKDPKCVDACPLHIDIKSFINCLVEHDFEGAFAKISERSPFPGICGRVCQHELFCEKACLLGKKLEPVAIGALERFVADHHNSARDVPPVAPTGPRVALVGSGPASLIAAGDLARKGYRVTVFEALHEPGGVLIYGIPPFRLPRDIIRTEIDRLRGWGVEFRTNFLVGRTATLDDLFAEGFAAIFLGTGAGLPYLMGIPGENLVGVYTANEFLTRLNLMHAHEFPHADTPVRVGRRTVVVGGGNSAMDAARWARRMGAEVTILFRRGRAELRARVEEIAHAEEEGVRFEFLAAPVALYGDENGVLREMECIRMQLGAPDSSGRPAPVPIPGSEYRIPVDTVVAAVGQGPNPTVQQATPQLVTRSGKIAVDDFGRTSVDRVFAGGDVARGGSTVILAMRDGRAAAESIDKALREQGLAPAASAASLAPRGFRIRRKRMLSPTVAWLEVEAPEIARKWAAGQFVMVRLREGSERIPLTLVDSDSRFGTIVLVVQAVGKSTREIIDTREADRFQDVLGPLGKPATVPQVEEALCVAGGVGVAELLPVAAAWERAGTAVVALCGARTHSARFLDAELRQVARDVRWATDDGSSGFHGTVVDLMQAWQDETGRLPAFVHTIGPIPMMRAAAELTRRWGVPTVASLNPIMVDGTGMCGGCRVLVGGQVRFACVEGPEFDAHQVDFADLTRRNAAYRDQERAVLEAHECRLLLPQPAP